MRALLTGLLDLLLPPVCAGCGRAPAPDLILCRSCDARLTRLPRRGCLRCGAPAPPGARCRRCAARGGPLRACVAAAAFEGDVETWIHRFKYPAAGLRGLDPGPAGVAGALIREAAARVPPPRPDLIVPVPLHPARLRARGYNPAERLARALARELALPLAPAALERVRDTPSQTGLDRSARARNVARAFRARPGLRLPRRVWLIDDVVTTGATLYAAARALRRAGARELTGVCVARTPEPRA